MPKNIINTFEELELMPSIKRALDDMGFEEPTEIQAQAIPLVRSGKDIIGRSQTGTGKTMAFAVPAIEKINTHEDKPSIQVLIMLPTRELALQCSDEIKKLTKYTNGIRPVEVYGGTPMDLPAKWASAEKSGPFPRQPAVPRKPPAWASAAFL